MSINFDPAALANLNSLANSQENLSLKINNPNSLNIPTSTSPLPRAPVWVAPTRVIDAGSLARASIRDRPVPSRINQTAATVNERTGTAAGRGQPIRLVLGGDRLGADITLIKITSTGVYYRASWCQGEIPAGGITNIKINGETPLAGVTFTHYYGTPTQGVDSTLAAVVSGYADTCTETIKGVTIGDAYSVVFIPQGSYQGLPNIEADIASMLVPDPRQGGALVSTTNAGLLIGAYATNGQWGLGRTVLDSDISALANWCDELLSDGQTKRGEIKYSIIRRGPALGHLEAMAATIGAIYWDDGQHMRIIPDKPYTGEPVLHITDADVIGEPEIIRSELGGVPTAVSVFYSVISETIRELAATVESPLVQAGIDEARVYELRLAGIYKSAIANRRATTLLNKFSLEDLRVRVRIRDKGLIVEPWDVVTFTWGPINVVPPKQFRVNNIYADEPGRFVLDLIEYQPETYSDEIQSEGTIPDTGLPPITVIPDPDGLDIIEAVYKRPDGTYANRLQVFWEPIEYPYRHTYRVSVTIDGVPADGIDTQQSSIYLNDAIEGAEYDITLSVYTPLGQTSNSISLSYTPLGEDLNPSDVPFLNVEVLAAGTVKLSWGAAFDIGVWRYEIRQGAAWDDAIVVNRVDALSLIVEGLTPGESYIWWVAAVDSRGHYSLNPVSSEFDLALPPKPAGISGYEVGGIVFLSVQPAGGVNFVERYEWRYGQPGGFNWDSGTLLDITDTLTLQSSIIPQGQWTFAVKSKDARGGESAEYVSFTLNVSQDIGAFLVDRKDLTISPAGLTNVHMLANPWLQETLYYTAVNSDTFNSVFGTTAAVNLTNPWAAYHANVASELVTDAADYGTQISGNWLASVDPGALVNSENVALELSADGVIWETQQSLSAKATARYARVRISAVGNETILYKDNGFVRVDAIPREESKIWNYTPGKYAMEFDGVGDRLERLHNSNLAITGDLTIAAWVRRDDWGAEHPAIISKGVSQTQSAYQLRFSGPNLRFTNGNGVSSFSTDINNLELEIQSKWFHVAITRNGSNIKMFINGILRRSQVQNITPADSGQDIDIGQYADTWFLTGAIFDLRVYNVARADADIPVIMREMGNIGLSAGLMAAWLNTNSLNDSSGNGFTLNSHGNPIFIPQGARIFWDNAYTAIKEITVTPFGNAPTTAKPDNITPGEISFVDVFNWVSNTGVLTAGTGTVKWFGV